MTYHYHGLKPSVDESINDYTDIGCYDRNSTYPLLEMWDPKTGLCVKQFLQIMINNSNNAIHMFLALQNIEGTVIEDTLWSLDDINKHLAEV